MSLLQTSVGNFNLDMVATAYDPCSELRVYTSNRQENIITNAVKNAGIQAALYDTVNLD